MPCQPKKPTALLSNTRGFALNHDEVPLISHAATQPSPSKPGGKNAMNMSPPIMSPTSEPPRKRLKFADEAVTVVVGSERVSFLVHKGVICESSPFFETVLCGNFQEATTKQVAIPDVDPASFEIFLQYLYSDFVCPCHVLERKETESPCHSWPLTIELYCLAQHLRCPAFGNSLINCIRARLNDKLPVSMPTSEDINTIYSHTVGDCGLRRLVVLMNITMMRGGIVLNTEGKARAWIADMPTEFVKDLAIKLLKDDCAWCPGFWGQNRVRGWLRDKIKEYPPKRRDQSGQLMKPHDEMVELSE